MIPSFRTMYNTTEIEQRIPHRPPFLFIDRVIENDGETIVAERAVREDEPHFAGHFPGNPILPGVLICEAAFQAGAVLLADRLVAEGKSLAETTPVLSRIVEAKFRTLVRPGDTLEIRVKHREKVSRFHFLDATILVAGKRAATVSFALAVL